PIVIGQGCEFDYSGVQACRALKEEGYRIVLVNSNPATIMTDPEFADATYIEPITPETVEKILAREKALGTPIDALLPTLGGQTGLNTGIACFDRGILTRFGVKMIGADRQAIFRGEDRQVFKDLMIRIGLKVPRSGVVHNLADAHQVREQIGLPLIIRPAFTLGGTGGGIAYNLEEFETIVQRGLDASPVREVLIEQSVLGWKEFELEVIRDKNDNVVVICSIENMDPMGVHTGDSITVAPVQTLTDKEYQRMRDAAIAVIRAVGVETGGSNIQFAINPADGEMVVVEMNPRVSRSSALASKATGFPIAKIAAKLAVGYTLDELANDITSVKGKDGHYERHTSACFEPSIDYCVIKIPRWTFEKFPDADETLTTQMKSVGEAMAIGRTFKEALQKGIRSMEVKRYGFGLDRYDKWLNATKAQGTNSPGPSDADDKTLQGESLDPEWPIPVEKLRRKLAIPSQGRLYYLRYAMKMGWSIEQIHDLTKIDPWFLAQMKQLVDFEDELLAARPTIADGDQRQVRDFLRRAKKWGYSDVQFANALGMDVKQIRKLRAELPLRPVYKLVDTCAAEFEAATPYYYSTYEEPFTVRDAPEDRGLRQISSDRGAAVVVQDEVRLTNRPKVLIIGGGPNRIGQGIEFDYCCVQAAFAMKELNIESVMINSNPETVSTDYDTSDLLFFEPLTLEDVLNIFERLNVNGNVKGAIVQFGGQTPLNLARGLKEAGVPILGTSVDSLDAAGDREQFRTLLQKLNLKQPANGIARSAAEARQVARRIGYPVLVRPSFVLGGRAMEIVSDEEQLNYYMAHAVEASTVADAPILVDKFLDAATEVDVDCIADTDSAVIIGVMEHIEEAGIHSGDSACSLPPYSLAPEMVEELKRQTRELARALRVRGLMNVQYAIKDSEVYVLEVNPRASRTVPFVSKATGVPWAKIAAKVMAGKTLAELGAHEIPDPKHVSVKEVVFPFSKFPGVDVILGPEMRSTGEVMGIDTSFPEAFAKSQLAAGTTLPTSGTVYISVRQADHEGVVPMARSLAECGFSILASAGTHATLRQHGIAATLVPKLADGRPNIIDHMKNGKVQLIINTPTRKGPATDEGRIRALSVMSRVPIVTTLTGAAAVAKAIHAMQQGELTVRPLQSYFQR
ncbi:MAG TPA: carbamoyl-phosphate synthase large subunit, partial [Tepidisphaeraceae bacterium]|nr:carbamoyl-phosphate synthase large subunit [Tepidisphaeraceae bacterium]